MRLKNGNNFKLDLSKLIDRFKEEYKNIYLYQFEDQVFIYRAVGRKEYTDLALKDSIGDEEKEEQLCKICTLFPKNYDFENCEEAGLPTLLANEIIENSYLSKENRDRVMAYYRNEMYNLDNQINCIILSAFPHLRLEEIENWDVVTANKYLSRAEWILHNIGGIPLREADEQSDYVYQKENAVTEEITDDQPIKNTGAKPVKKAGKTTMTPQKLAELKAKYPDIDWENDSGKLGVDGIRNAEAVDSRPVALRPRSQVFGNTRV